MRVRFIIRDLLWLALVVALIVGWWLDHASLSPLRDELAAEQGYAKQLKAQLLVNESKASALTLQIQQYGQEIRKMREDLMNMPEGNIIMHYYPRTSSIK